MVQFRVWARLVDPAASAEHVRVGSGRDQRSFRPILNDLLGLVGFVLQNHFLPRRVGVAKPRQLLCGLILSDTIFRIFESTVFGGRRFSSCFSGCPSLTSAGDWAVRHPLRRRTP
jgi:hypothetical protein